MKDQDRAVGGGEPALRRIEMTLENLSLAHPVVGEKAISCLRAGPVLAGQRNALPEPGSHLLNQLAKPPVQSTVAKPAPRKLLVKPTVLHTSHLLAADSVPDKESRPIPSTQLLGSAKR